MTTLLLTLAAWFWWRHPTTALAYVETASDHATRARYAAMEEDDE